MKKLMKVVFLKLMFNTKIKLPELHNGIRLLQKKKANLYTVNNLYDKNEYVIHTKNLK